MPNYVIAILIAITIIFVLAMIWMLWGDIDDNKH